MPEEVIDILLIEDDEAHAELIKRAFESYSTTFRPTVAETLQEARQYLGRASPHLILCDIFLPDGNGIDILESVGDRPEFPVVVMTSHGSEQLAVEAMKAGAFDYVVKSVETLADMGRITERVLREWSHITERKRVEKALKESEEKYRDLYENAPIAYFSVNTLDGSILRCNRAMENLTGYDKETLLKMKVFDLFGPSAEVQSAGFEVFEKFREGKPLRDVELQMRHKSGDIRWISLSFEFIRDQEGNISESQSAAIDITERKLADEKLRDAEASLKNTFDISPGLICVADANAGIFTECNPAVTRILGFSVEEFTSTPFMEFVHPDDRQRTVDEITEQLRGSAVAHFENRYRCKDGSYKWLAWQATAADKDGKVHTVATDITKRKQAEEALAQREYYYRTLIYSLHEDILVIDRDYRVTDVNNSAMQTLGMTREEVIGRHCYEVSYGLDTPCHEQGEQCGLRIVLETGEFCNLHREHVTADGEKTHVDIRISPMKDEDGNITHVVEAVRDVTELFQAQEMLRESEERYRTILESMEEGYYEVDLAGNFTFFNDAMCKIRGISRDELMGMSNRDYMTPETAKEVYKAYNKVYTTGEPAKNLEWLTIRPDGTERYVETSTSLIKDSGNVPTGFRGIVRDVTERIRSEEEKKKLEAQLQQAQKMEAIGTLAGGIAHDFNNILGAIIGYSDLALRDISEDDPNKYYLEQINQAGFRAKDLVKQILLFSRQQEHEKVPVKFGPLMKEAAKLLRASIPSTIEIHTSISAQSDLIQADPSQVHQILMNLCTNAAHAMRGESGVLSISLDETRLDSESRETLSDLRDGPFLILRVSDTGHGIPESVMDRIFDPFFTTKARGEGTGLGLSVVHGIVRDHGGTILVNSEMGKGTSFEVFFPLIEDAGKKSELEALAPIPGGKERVFFIDDEPALVELGKKMLEPLGYTIHTETGSIDALETFRSQPDRFDIIITDLTMPGMTGLELAREIMKIKPDTPVILCTGFSDQVTAETADKIGIKKVLLKPFIAREMTEAIRRVLDQ